MIIRSGKSGARRQRKGVFFTGTEYQRNEIIWLH